MKRSFNRSKSYTEQGYVPLATEESEAEDVFTSDNPVTKRPSPRRSFSDSGADKVKPSIEFHSITSNIESNMPTAQEEERAEFVVDEEERQENPTENDTNRSKGNKKIILAIGLFTISLILHLYSLVNFLEEKKSEENYNSPSQMSRLNGSQINIAETAHSCLLTINYTTDIINNDDFERNCTPTKEHNKNYEFCNQSSPQPTYLSMSCFCAKRIPRECTTTAKNINCSDCKNFFPKCRHNTSRVTCVVKCDLNAPDCGRCDCRKTDFTGEFCHLPNKLECRRCLTENCTSLPPCNNSTKYPCQNSFNSTVMKCTEKENKNAKDCSLEQDKTEKTTNDYERIEKTENGSADSQKITISNATQSDRKTCSRTSKIGFFVLDWVVFVAVIFHILYAVCQKFCPKCTRELPIPDILKGRETIYYIYFVAVLLLVVIPPIVNCVTCCSTACDVIGKTIPFVKAGFLVVVPFLLRNGYDDNDNRQRYDENQDMSRIDQINESREMETINNA